MNRPFGRLAVMLLAGVLAAPPARATTVPTGFVHEMLVGEPFVSSPVGFCFLPDGRFVLVEQASGVVRIAAAGAATSDSIFTMPDVRADHAERGLLGVAADPAWPARPYLYFHFTSTDSTVKVVMYAASGDVAVPTSTAVTLADRFALLDAIDDDDGIHNAGTLRFAPDGMLWVSVGDDAKACQAQDSTSVLGKLLRLDVSAMPGAGPGPPPVADLAPADNPFGGTAGFGPLVRAWGLRNPFRFTVDGPTGDVFIGSVGSHLFEEINRVPASSGAPNLGWPQWEGFAEVFCCGDCGDGNPFTDPIHVIPHPAGVISVIGGPRLRRAPASPASFPASYDGDLLFAEIFSGDLVRLRESAGSWAVAPDVPGQPAPGVWGAGFVGASDVQLGDDGAVYVLSRGLNAAELPRGLHRIRADPGATAAPPTVADRRDPVVMEPNPARAGRGAVLRYHVSGGGPAVVRVLDAGGRVLCRLRDDARAPGDRTLLLDGRTTDGRPLPPGVHFVEVRTASGARLTGRTVWVR